MSTKSYYYFAIVICVGLVAVIILNVIFSFYEAIIKIDSNLATHTHIILGNTDVRLRGIITTTGLSLEESKGLGLAYGKYQVVVSKPLKPQTSRGYYLDNPKINFSVFIGKCVEVEGSLVLGWTDPPPQEINGQFTYSHSAINVESIKPAGSSQGCFQEQTLPKDMERTERVGILKRAIRMAPDTGYDYEIFLDKGIKVDNAAVYGLIHSQAAVPANTAVWEAFEKYIGRRVKLSGFSLWGYAESIFFLTDKIELL